MVESTIFPLLSGALSLDFINTEVVRRGVRHHLLVSEGGLTEWIRVMVEAGALHPAQLGSSANTLGAIDDSTPSLEALHDLLEFRDHVRAGFEEMADGNMPEDAWYGRLEELIRLAPFSYKLVEVAPATLRLVPIPLADPHNQLKALIAYDVLRLLSSDEWQQLRRCTNPDCVLLFMDASGRRKWCSMKICGNRTKVARHQAKQK